MCHIDDFLTRRGSLFSDPPKPDSAAEDEEDVRKSLILWKGREWIVHWFDGLKKEEDLAEAVLGEEGLPSILKQAMRIIIITPLSRELCNNVNEEGSGAREAE